MRSTTRCRLVPGLTTGALAGVLLSSGVILGQPPAGRGRNTGPEFVRAGFERSAPDIGESLPDLSLYQADGKEVRLHEVLNGRYTVLILGCLT